MRVAEGHGRDRQGVRSGVDREVMQLAESEIGVEM